MSKRSPGLAERLLAIGEDCAARLKEPYRSADHGDLLYDDRGMPNGGAAGTKKDKVKRE